MDWLLDLLQVAGKAVIGMVALPYVYLAILLVWWQSRNAVTLQRKLFHVRLYGTLQLTLSRAAAGFAAAVVLSALSFGAGAELTGDTLLYVWIMMAALALLRLRYICLAYAAGALGVVQAIVDAANVRDGAWSGALNAIAGIDVPSLLFLAGLLHIAEGALVRLQAARLSVPLFLEGKRGKPIGGYALSGAWPIPLLWLVPAAGGEGFGLPWTPLFGLGDGVASWTLLAFPVVVGFSDRTQTFWPERKARDSGNALIVYGALLAALAAGAIWWPPLGIVAAVAAFALHEALVLLGRQREKGRKPVYAQEGGGVKILAVLPSTPAAEMGLQSGETIVKANGAPVRTKEELHDALQLQAAFCKLDVLNREGHLKFVQRARYFGEHYQLGLVLAPDESVEFVAAPRSASIWQGLQEAGARRRAKAAAEWAASEMAAAAEDEAPATEPVPAAESAEPAEPEAPPVDPGLPPRKSRDRRPKVE